MTYRVSTPPAVEPLTLSEMKNYLKVPASVTADDAYITALITEARQYVERKTARALITQTVTEYWDEFPAVNEKEPRVIRPYIAPVQSVTSLKYVDENGTPTTYTLWDNTGNAKYWVDIVSGRNGIGSARIIRNSDVDWPEIADFSNAVEVVYVAGYGSAASDVPGPLKMAMRRLVGIWYFGRDARNVDEFSAVAALLEPYKIWK